jgi:DNA repair exonuclease SbcCD nuclease subunit
MRLLHLADVHLDRPFVGLPLDDARARRRELRATFEWCLAVAGERGADLITIGGDLWEHEHVTPDTLRWVRDRLIATRLPVVLVAGNHDPLSPGGPYDRVEFAEPVGVLPANSALHEHRVGDLSVWGMSWRQGVPLSADVLTQFRVPDDGRSHVLLLHGTCGAFFDDAPHCPFSVAQVREAGFDLCLAGHLHAATVRDELVVYPGSPEPLGWSETGRHTLALVDLDDGHAAVELVDVATHCYAERDVSCDGAESSAEVERRLLTTLDELETLDGVCLRVRLTGRVVEGCAVDPEALRASALARGLTMLVVDDLTAVAFDLDALAIGNSVSAVFVGRLRELLDERPDDATLDLALQLGLRALHGEEL